MVIGLFLVFQISQVWVGDPVADALGGLLEAFQNWVGSFVSSEIPEEWNTDALRGYFYGILTDDNDFRYDSESINSVSTQTRNPKQCKTNLLQSSLRL